MFFILDLNEEIVLEQKFIKAKPCYCSIKRSFENIDSIQIFLSDYCETLIRKNYLPDSAYYDMMFVSKFFLIKYQDFNKISHIFLKMNSLKTCKIKIHMKINWNYNPIVRKFSDHVVDTLPSPISIKSDFTYFKKEKYNFVKSNITITESRTKREKLLERVTKY